MRTFFFCKKMLIFYQIYHNMFLIVFLTAATCQKFNFIWNSWSVFLQVLRSNTICNEKALKFLFKDNIFITVEIKQIHRDLQMKSIILFYLRWFAINSSVLFWKRQFFSQESYIFLKVYIFYLSCYFTLLFCTIME